MFITMLRIFDVGIFSMGKFFLFVSTFLLCDSVLGANKSSTLFIGAKGGYQLSLDDAYKQHSNPQSAMFGVYSGIYFSPAWRYDFGYQHHNDLNTGITSINIKTWLIENALRYDLHLKDNLSAYGRFGVAYWDMEKTRLSSGALRANGFSPLGEIGINFDFSPSLQLSVGYQYVDSIGNSSIGEYDSHGLLVSLTHTFTSVTQSTFAESVSTTATKDIPATLKEVALAKPVFQTQTFSINGVFAFDSIELNHDFIRQLTGIVSVLKAYPQAQAVVIGYTDSTGSKYYNKKLSERRAQAVADYMLALNVDREQISIIGKGEVEAIESNSQSARRAKNRKVEVTIPSFKY